MGNSASDFVKGISTAQSHLDAFNSELFVSAQEQHELEEQMQEVQKGITEICKRASDERRGYTQEEVKQLDEYFEKLRQLNEREIQIQQGIAEAITQQATLNAKTFEGTLEEYKTYSQEWLKTAEEQKEKTIELINKQSIEEIALLNTRFTTEESRQTHWYQYEVYKINQQKQAKIDAANDEIAKINQAYANGYLERTEQEDNFYNTLKEYTEKQEKMEEGHNERIRQYKNNEVWYVTDTYSAIKGENEAFAKNQKEYWEEMYSNMDETQEKQLGVWLAMVSQTEMYGGEIDDETKRMVDSVIASFDSMPKETQEAMKNAMEPMLTEMQNKEPVLYAKATGIADGILSRLKKAFDIHSPSKETKKIFENVMKGAEEGLDAERNNLNLEIDQITNSLRNKLASLNPMRNLDNLVVERNKTIYTTPNIVFNVQELDKQRLEQCFNYVNLKFGAQY